MIGAIERFAESSRRYDHGRAGTLDDGMISCDLPHPFGDMRECLRSLPAAVAGWVDGGMSTDDRRRLLLSCMKTGGARIGALLRAPELRHRVLSGEIDRIACYSSKDFGLAEHLAAATGSACTTLLDRGTRYLGEFAFELLAVIPHAYWLHQQGRLEFTVATKDTRALYYFSPCHEEREGSRRYIPITEYPVGVRGALRYDRKGFPSSLDTTRWAPPPYKSVYDDGRFRWMRDCAVICNKRSGEQYLWHRAPANFIDTGTLLELIRRLRSRFQVIYVRPQSADIVNDHQAIREAGDIEAVTSSFPDVITIQQLHSEYSDVGYNELQLRLFAGCRRFVSVLGGSSYLASYFGGTNVVLARRGWEVAADAYRRWFHLFSGARVVPARSASELLGAVESELVSAR